ncbi:MAG TPA: NAD(P)-dependent oxidoreductase [Polyangiaceae bacterium]|nr:NAD(P)-dependent oxidoreductase [Polyangiaceae bacterium]
MARVLVTGSAGAIGQPVCAELLRRGHHVRGLDRVRTPGVDDAAVVDLVDRDSVRAAARGVDCIVHLGAYPDDADFALLEGPNVRGLFHVLDAARQEGVKRVVLASSIQALGEWWDMSRKAPAGARDGLPTNHYGLTKVWAEHMGEMYARCYGLSILAVRIAFMVRNPEEARRLEQQKVYDMYLSRGDVGRFFALAVEAIEIDFAVVYAVGAGGERRFDMEPARRLLGFEARDRWPEGLGFDPPPSAG